jgi:hypothetical protein
MSIVGGLVDTHADQSIVARHTVVGDWAMRNAWGLILTGSFAFWLALAALLIWG